MSTRENSIEENRPTQAEEMETEDLPSVEEAVENQLLDDTSSEVQSCSSSILDTPKRNISIGSDSDDNVNVTIKPATGEKSTPSLSLSEEKARWRKRITRAQKNQIKKLLETGVSKEDARRQVFSSDVLGTPSAAKRTRDNEQVSSGEKPSAKKTKSNLCPKERAGLHSSYQTTSKQEVDQSQEKTERVRGVLGRPKIPKASSGSGGHSYRDVVSMVRVGIIVKGFPYKQMSTTELDAVQNALLLKIEEQRNAEVKPKFTKCSYKQGYLALTCKDQVTALWLKEVAGSLTPWEKAELLALDEKDIPRPDLFHAFFPMSADFSDERLKGFIESQNDEVTTNSWRILSRSNSNKHAEWTIHLDEESHKILSKRNFVLNFRFGETRLRKVKPSSLRQTDSEKTYDNPRLGNDTELINASELGTDGVKPEDSGICSNKLIENAEINVKNSQTANNNKHSSQGTKGGLVAPPKKHQGATNLQK